LSGNVRLNITRFRLRNLSKLKVAPKIKAIFSRSEQVDHSGPTLAAERMSPKLGLNPQ
jgi:hypothetical protein